MKHYPPPAPPGPAAPLQRRRLPAFHPVPVTPRADGWTARRQADFIGCLAQTRSVLAAARAAGMGRESAYRLRKRPGAAGFAAAWDTALERPHNAVDLASAKATGLSAAYRARTGLIQVAMEHGRYVGSYWKDDANALLEHLAQIDRSSMNLPGFGARSQRLQPAAASAGGVDFAGG
jgi:hypothetical protein